MALIRFSDISAEIPAHSIVGVTGKSGSGKSTLLKLFMRFWSVQQGKVKISQTDIGEINTADLRNMESFMTQETHLFHDSIKKNLYVAKPDASDEEIIAACKKASIHDLSLIHICQVIRDLYGAGCRNIQFDDCSWGVCADPNAQAIFGTDEAGLREIQEQLLRVNNLAMEGKPGDLTVNTHVCRGNFHSTWACRGGYDTVAETLFARENVDAFFLEYDDERSGGFEPLRAVPADKTVVLGLVTTKAPKLEDKAEVIGRIREAARYVPLERLCLIPQCGLSLIHI